ncbi:MAG: molybdopterin-dependent oxidoreductase [Pseudomonadales bacterium]|nr:molybdopterin-dependent oxidoreductase [Pseudomonadales bacterium]
MSESIIEEKQVVCSSCDGFCPLTAKVKDGRVVKVSARNTPFLKDVICVKGAYAPKSFAHPDRLMKPKRRIGPRGSGQWEEVSWEEALDDIAGRLKGIVHKYGPESLAVSTSFWNTTVDNGLGRRFMNLLGTPNFISGVAYCMGNTAAVNRMIIGWYPRADIANTDCILLIGHNPRRHSWTAEYKGIRVAQAKGTKLIVFDPRKSENAEVADLWLPVRAGTDAALLYGLINVILEEELYDQEFVRDWTVGFDEFVERCKEYPLERVSEITGCSEESIRSAARMFATSKSACIPWSPITDQQVSSTSAIRLQIVLSALTGNLDAKGGQIMDGFNPHVVTDTAMELHDVLSEEQKGKQLGSDEFPVFTYRGMRPLREATERVWGSKWANLISGCYMANPTSTFRAMAHGDPYPVKAFFALGNNTLMSYANTRQIYDGLMNQELVVVYEHMMTPTAELADYVLPGDSWLERPSMMVGVSDQGMQPPGECKSVFYFWSELARRMGFEKEFSWKSLEELYDHRLEPGGNTWIDVLEGGYIPTDEYRERKYESTGFATPSGKVELYSSVLEDLGFDPLPYYREATKPNTELPLSMMVGVRDDEYFQTGHRHVPELRKRAPDPTMFINPKDAQALELNWGDWVRVINETGSVHLRADIREQMPVGLIRVPHGWWKPETRKNVDRMSGMWSFSDAQLSGDDDTEYLDIEQGIPHLKGLPCRVEKLSDAEIKELESKYGKTVDLPVGPKGRVIANGDSDKRDFMYDEALGDGVEFEAIELAHYGRGSLN